MSEPISTPRTDAEVRETVDKMNWAFTRIAQLERELAEDKEIITWLRNDQDSLLARRQELERELAEARKRVAELKTKADHIADVSSQRLGHIRALANERTALESRHAVDAIKIASTILANDGRIKELEHELADAKEIIETQKRVFVEIDEVTAERDKWREVAHGLEEYQSRMEPLYQERIVQLERELAEARKLITETQHKVVQHVISTDAFRKERDQWRSVAQELYASQGERAREAFRKLKEAGGE